MFNILSLPTELLCDVGSRLDFRDLYSLAMSNRTMYVCILGDEGMCRDLMKVRLPSA